MQDKEALDQAEESLTTVGENNSSKKGDFKDREDSFEEVSSKKDQSPKDGKFAFRKMKQPKKEKADKKNSSTKFTGEGVSFKAKLIGTEEVSDPRGDKMCQDSMFRLKMNVKNQGPHKRKIVISVSLEGIKIKDEKSGELIYHHTVPRISFISQDIADARAFGYVASSADGTHEFIAIKTEKPAFHVVLALRDLFQTVLSLKQEKMEQVKEKKTGEQDTASSVGSDSLNEKSSVPEEVVDSSKDEAKSTQENIYFDVILSEPFPVKDFDAEVSTTCSEEKETKTVDDLLCLQDELNKLQQGIAQMDTSIAAVTSTIGVKDPFDTSFLTPGGPKMDSFPLTMPAPVPVPAANAGAFDSNPMPPFYEDKYAVFNAVDNEPSIFDSAVNREVPELHDLEEEIKQKSVASPPAKPPRNSKAITPSDLSVFADLDPLGKDRPYKDKTEFFQELKNPPKKVLKDLLDNSSSSSSHEDLLNRAFDSGIGSPPRPFPASVPELVSQNPQSLASSLPNSFLSNLKFSAFTQNGNGNPFNPFEKECNGLSPNHVNGYSQGNPGHLSNKHVVFGSKRDSLESSQDSDGSSPIPIPSRSQQFFEQRERASSSGSTSTTHSRSPCTLDSSRSSSQADVAGSSPVPLKATNGYVNHDGASKMSNSDSNPSINGTPEMEYHLQNGMSNGKTKQNGHSSVSRPRPRPSLSKGNSIPNGGGITIPHPISTSVSSESEYINRENMQSIANMLQVHGRRTRAASLPVDTHRIPYPAEKNIFAKKSDPFGDEFFCSLPKKVPNHIPAAEIPEYA